MANTGKIENTYGNAMNVAIANTYAKNVLQASYLPKSSIIVSTEYDTQDIGHAAMLVTDNNGVASEVSNYIIEKNGLHSLSNSNVVSLNIDNNTLNVANGSLSIDITNFLDNSSLVDNGGMQLDSQSLTKASNKSFGVAKVDNSTVKSDNGTLYVNTEKLDLASQSNEGIVKGDNSTITINKGVLKANTYNLQKTSSSTYGVAKADGNLIASNEGVVSIATNGFTSIAVNGNKMHKADNASILANNGVLSINNTELRKANETNAGIVNIDQNSISISNDNKIQIKDIDRFDTFIYDYNEGMDEIESKITYLRNLLDNGNLVYSEPEIRHLTCNETTTAILAKPEYLEEPINMEIQYVYVSLNVITNCKFVVEVMYDNNIVPNVELESINYNDEFTISGIDCLEYVWPSTGMKEKNIVLLFNSKNFLSSTLPSTDVTKLSIAVTAYDDNTKTKRIIYSIIRYNSFYGENEIEPEPDQEFIEYSAEYVVDEKNSQWFIININPDSVDYWDKNTATFNPKEKYIVASGVIGGSDVNSTIKVDQIEMVKNNQESYVLYLNGVYIHKESGKRFSFLKEIPVEYFDTVTVDTGISQLRGRGVYDYPYQVEFDTLYFQIRYQVDNSAKVCISPSSSETRSIYTYHELNEKFGVYFRRDNAELQRNYISFNNNTNSYYWSFCDCEDSANPGTYVQGMKYIANTYLCINNTVLPASVDENNVVKYIDTNDNNKIYASIDLNNCYLYNEMSIDGSIAEYTSLQLDHNFKDYDVKGGVKLYFVIPISFADIRTIGDLEDLYNRKFASYIDVFVNKMQYDTNTYLYSNDTFTYGSQLPTIYCYSSFTYSINDGPMRQVNPNESNLTYKMIDLYVDEDKVNDSSFSPVSIAYYNSEDEIEITYDLLDENGTYNATISYNFSYGDGEQYWNDAKHKVFDKQVYSNPKFVVSGISINTDNGLIVESGSNVQYYASSFNNINGAYAYDTEACASSMLLAYSYIYSQQQLEYPISLSNGGNLISMNIPDEYRSSSYSLNISMLYKDNDEWNLDILPPYQINSTHSYAIANEDNANKYVFAYISTTNASEMYSNVVCGVVPEFETDNLDIQNETTYFVDYNNSVIYGYSYIATEVEKHCLVIYKKDDDYTYLRDNTYFRIESEFSMTNSIENRNNILDVSTESAIAEPNEVTDNDLIIHIGGEFSSNGITYVAYDLPSTNSVVFCLGSLDESEFHELNSYISAYISYCIGNTYHYDKLTITSDNSNIIGVCANNGMFDAGARYLTLETSSYNGIVFNSSIYELYSVANDPKILAMSQFNSIEDDLMSVFTYLNGNDCEVINEKYFRLYDANTSSYCQFTDINHYLNISDDCSLDNLTSDHLIYQLLDTNGSIAYAYNIPNVKNLAQYCDVDVYADYVVPRFKKKFDSYFTPYNFSVSASYGDETKCLNARLENATYVDFSIKYKGTEISNTRINLQTPVADSQTNVIDSYFVGTEEKASAKYSYSSSYEYAYWPINVTFDPSILDLYSNEECHGSAIIDLSDLQNGAIILDDTKVVNSLSTYLYNYDNYICWTLDNYNTISNTYEFNLAANSNNNYNIWPELIPNYDMMENIMLWNYDLEQNGGTSSSGSSD